MSQNDHARQMRFTVLPGNQEQIGLANPVAFSVNAQHVSESELLPWQKRHLDQVSQLDYIIDLGLAF